MKSTIMRHTDAGKPHIGAQRRRLWSVSLLTGLILVAISASPTWAKLSNATGTIEGRAPTATGTLSVMFLGSTTAVTDNAVVSATMKPSDFWVSAAPLTLHDLDGDTGLSSSIDTAAVTWDWKYNGVALTPAQLTAPFSTNFLGKTLTVAASAPVTVSSLTGVPKQNTPATFNSATYTLVVPATLPVVRVNGASFAMDSGFPKTGFSQAQFQLLMDGTSAAGNSNYTFAADPLAPWVTVGQTTGVVKFISEPAAAQTVNITISDNRGGPTTTYSFRVGTWFINNGSSNTTAADADSYCASKTGYATPSASIMSNAVFTTNNSTTGTRAPDGRLYSEWGRVGSAMDYVGSGWSDRDYWIKETEGTKRNVVNMRSGYIGVRYVYEMTSVACSRTL